VLDREYPTSTRWTRLRARAIQEAGDVVGRLNNTVTSVGAIGWTSRRARQFGSFGQGSLVCFPLDTLVNPASIHIGSGTIVAAHAVLSAGWMPDQPNLGADVVRIGDRCLIGRGSTVVGHTSIVIGDDVWTGHNVHITDMNHGYEDLDTPIGRQWMDPEPVVIGDRAWLGHGTVVLPGVHIGAHVVVGANSVVTTDLPDRCVAVGAPARVVRQYVDGKGWVAASEL